MKDDFLNKSPDKKESGVRSSKLIPLDDNRSDILILNDYYYFLS